MRAWTVRLLGDAKSVSASTASKLADLAAAEPDAVVRSQLACSARRLPADQGLPIVSALMRPGDDVDDRYIPLLLWWAIEAKATSDPDAVVALFQSKDAWSAPLARKHLIERAARRYTAERTDANFAACAKLWSTAPDESSVAAIIAGMDKGLEGAGRNDVPAPLEGPIAKLWEKTPRPAALVSVALRLGFPQAREETLSRIDSPRRPPASGRR